MTSLQGTIKWSHERLKVLSAKIMIFILVAIPDLSKTNLYEVIVTSLQGTIKWSHERLKVLSAKIMIFILVKEILLYTG